MKKYIGNRGSGKTYQLIQEARQNKGIVIVKDRSQAKSLKLQYPDMIDQIYSFDVYLMEIIVSGDFRSEDAANQHKLYIDDFDLIAADYIPGEVMAGTINIEGNIFMFSKGKM